MEDREIQMKTCKRCERELPNKSFYKNKNSKDGLYFRCKECHLAVNRDYWAKNKLRLKIERTKIQAKELEKLRRLNETQEERIKREQAELANYDGSLEQYGFVYQKESNNEN